MVEEYALELIQGRWILRDGSQSWTLDASLEHRAALEVCRLMRGWIRPRRVVRIDRFTDRYSVVVAVPEYDRTATDWETV